MEAARRNSAKVIAAESANYRKAHMVLTDLRHRWRRREITGQEYSTLRGQAISGNIDGAVKGLYRILERNATKGAIL